MLCRNLWKGLWWFLPPGAHSVVQSLPGGYGLDLVVWFMMSLPRLCYKETMSFILHDPSFSLTWSLWNPLPYRGAHVVRNGCLWLTADEDQESVPARWVSLEVDLPQWNTEVTAACTDALIQPCGRTRARGHSQATSTFQTYRNWDNKYLLLEVAKFGDNLPLSNRQLITLSATSFE